MAPKIKSSSQTSREKPKAVATLRARTVKLDAASPLSLKRLDPLTAFSTGLTLTPSGTSFAASSSQNQKAKGKAKEKSRVAAPENTINSGWTSMNLQLSQN